MNGIFSVLDKFIKIIEGLVVLIMTVMVVVIFLATVGRYSGLFSIPWSEECARYCMVAMVYIGAMVAANRGSHFVVEIVPMIFPKKVCDIINIFNIICVDVFAVFVLLQGWQISSKMLNQGKLTPMLELPLGAVYMVIPIGMIFMGIYYTANTAKKIISKEDLKEATIKGMEEST